MAKRYGLGYTKLKKVIDRDGPHCHYCGVRVYPGIDFTPGTLPDGRMPVSSRIIQYKPFVVVEHFMEWDEATNEYRGRVLWEYDPACNVATADHIVPFSKGGSNHIDNLVIACQPCNSQKGHRIDYETFKQMKAGSKT